MLFILLIIVIMGAGSPQLRAAHMLQEQQTLSTEEQQKLNKTLEKILTRLERYRHQSKRDGYFKYAKETIEQGADINVTTPYTKQTLLMFAAKDGRQDWIAYVIAKGAKINAINSQGRTALMAAAINGHLTVLKMLLDADANPLAIEQGTKKLPKCLLRPSLPLCLIHSFNRTHHFVN